MRYFAILTLAALIVVSFSTTTAQQPAAQPSTAPILRLQRANFDARTPQPAAPTTALAAAAPGSYRIIQFNGPITLEDRTNLEKTGLEILEYLPDYAYLVRGSATQVDQAAQLPHVYAKSPFTLADKFSPALLSAFAQGAKDVSQVLVLGWSKNSDDVQRSLKVANINPDSAFTLDQLIEIAKLPEVRWIEHRGQPRIFNERARQTMNVNPVWQQRGLYGNGQIIAVTDSGLDTGNLATLSPDFAGRIVATLVLSQGGDLGDNNGHGTHVAGSVAGSGVQSGSNPAQRQYIGSFAGVAPEARLVIQAFEATATGEVIGIPNDYSIIFNHGYNAGARIHTNSWGDYTGPVTDPASQFGGYVANTQTTDQWMWDHPDSVLLFASGNSAKDGVKQTNGYCGGPSKDGVIDPDSLLTPGTAKNVITVGANESLVSGGLSAYSWLYLDLVSYCFGTQPIAADPISNSTVGMAAFSSRGPTDDGRFKPDITAPGVNIISNQSHYPNAGVNWAAHETNPHYAYSGGTSMATPLTAGATALVRQWLGTRGFANPSGAAMKATLLNTSFNSSPGQYGTGPTQEIPFSRPNNVDGWGRTDLSYMNRLPPYGIWLDDRATGINTGQVITYNHTNSRPLEVITSTQPLRIMVAWTDPAGSLSAGPKLVNDLDLVVTGPGGVTYYGNNASAASRDRRNNVEGVIINNPPIGSYSVQVQGFNVPISSQRYALSVAGPVSTQSILSIAKTATPAAQVAPGGLLTYTLSLTAGFRAINETVVLTDSLPENTEFVSASNGGVQTGPGGSIIRWTVPSLAKDATTTRTLVVRVDSSTPENTLIVNNDYRAANSIDVPAIGQPVAVQVRLPRGALVLNKTANPASTVGAGGLITYTLTVNSQNIPVQTTRLTDTLPTNTSFVAASGAYTRSGPGGSIVSWPLDTVNPGLPAIRTLTVRVFSTAELGTVISNNNYRVGGANADPVVGPPVNVSVSTAQLTLSKVANPATNVLAGRNITYTLTIGAQNMPISGIVLTDTIPANTSLISASNKGQYTAPGSNVIQWKVTSLNPGQTLSITLVVRVGTRVFDGTVIRNDRYAVQASNAATVNGPPVNVTVGPGAGTAR